CGGRRCGFGLIGFGWSQFRRRFPCCYDCLRSDLRYRNSIGCAVFCPVTMRRQASIVNNKRVAPIWHVRFGAPDAVTFVLSSTRPLYLELWAGLCVQKTKLEVSVT